MVVALLPLAMLSGCKKKRPQLPPVQPPPTITQPQPQQQPGVAPLPPAIACSTSPASVKAGEASNISCKGSSPESRPLMYNCVPSAGQITPAISANVPPVNGSVVKLDTSDVAAGTVTVTCTATDDRGLHASTNVVVKVEAPPAPVTAKPKQPKPRKRHSAKKPAEKDKTVVPEGGESTASDQLSAGIPEDAATQQRRSTAHLRETTENNLRSITRPLNSDELAVLQQVRMFLSQSRAADSDGDTERAYRLALKAQLLSEELAKR